MLSVCLKKKHIDLYAIYISNYYSFVIYNVQHRENLKVRFYKHFSNIVFCHFSSRNRFHKLVSFLLYWQRSVVIYNYMPRYSNIHNKSHKAKFTTELSASYAKFVRILTLITWELGSSKWYSTFTSATSSARIIKF